VVIHSRNRISWSPQIFVDTYKAFKKYINQNYTPKTDKYIPYFYYEAFYLGDVSHEHPLWAQNANDTRIISDYLLSQAQVQNYSKRLYSAEYKNMAYSENPNRNKQWYNASNGMLDELALHYINIKKIEAHFTKDELKSKSRYKYIYYSNFCVYCVSFN
jgi:hypothetical protein